MKKIVLVFAAVCITISGFAQKTADIGIWGGTSGYFGDMDETNAFQPFNLNFGGYFRYNFNARVGLRAMILSGKFSKEGVIENEYWAFNKNVQDLSLQVEINYLKYILGVKNTPYTSYVTAGLGVAYFPYELDLAKIMTFNPNTNKIKGIPNPDNVAQDPQNRQAKSERVFTTSIPFGIGFKYTLGKRLGMGIEYQMRKLFSDKLDNLDDPLAFIDGDGKEVVYNDQIHNNDWSAYLGVHVTYKIYIGKKACPAYESKE